MTDKNEIGRVGEQHVARTLEGLGLRVREMPVNNPDHDLEAITPEGRLVRIQVKTSGRSRKDQPYWRMGRATRKCAAPDLFFVFVRLDEGGAAEEDIVVPSSVVERFINEANDHYYTHVSDKPDAGMYKLLYRYNHLPQYQEGWLAPYEGAWDLIRN